MGMGMDGYGWDLCVGLLYEHRFAVLTNENTKSFMSHMDWTGLDNSTTFLLEHCSESGGKKRR